MKLNSKLFRCKNSQLKAFVRLKAATATLLLLLSGCQPVSFGQAIITLDPNKTYQLMTGWEATAQAGQADSTFSRYNEALFDQAADLGVNRLRVEIRAGAENHRDWWSDSRASKVGREEYRNLANQIVNDNDDPFTINWEGFQFAELDYTIDKVVLPYKRRVEAKHERLSINVNYVNFGKSEFQHYSTPQEYAEFVLATYLHLREKYGLVPDAWEVGLEPDNTLWTGKTMGEAMVLAARRLIDHRFTPSFIVPSTTNAAKAPVFFDQIIEAPGAAQYIAEISYHRYRGATPDVLRQIRERVLKFNLKSGMLEYIGADYRMLHEDIKEGWISSWQQYTLAFPTNDNGAQYFTIDNRNATQPVIVMGSRTKFLRQYFKYVRMDAVRIEAASNNNIVDPVAFRNSNGGFVVVVKTDGGGKFTIQGLPAGTYGISYTTGNEDHATLPDVTLEAGKALPASIPTTGVLTAFAR